MRGRADTGKRLAEPANPYAFPHVDPRGGSLGNMGMDLRDYFAASAMVGMAGALDTAFSPSSIAQRAYRIADAMLAAREGVQGE